MAGSSAEASENASGNVANAAQAAFEARIVSTPESVPARGNGRMAAAPKPAKKRRNLRRLAWVAAALVLLALAA